MPDTENAPVLAAAADLLFAARMRAAAEAAQVPLQLARAGDDLAAQVLAVRPRLVLLDMDARWLDAPALIRRLKSDAATSDIPVVCYVSHVREAMIAAARTAGADRVLARSAFVRVLPELLRGRPPS